MYASVDTFGVKIGRSFTPKFLMVLDFGIHDGPILAYKVSKERL